jgi:hypothetical protein
MRTAPIFALCLVLTLAAGCASFAPDFTGNGLTSTIAAPMARVKPAFISTLAQLGLPVSAMETRGGIEVVKAKKAGQVVEIEFERLGIASTGVRVTGNSETAARIMRESERRLAVR